MYAANTSSAGDHPRMRGEKYDWCASAATLVGSPPHARGKGFPLPKQGIPSGITPACAGKSEQDAEYDRVAEDHPRMRGEKSRGSVMSALAMGSPPHARGKAKGIYAVDQV